MNNKYELIFITKEEKLEILNKITQEIENLSGTVETKEVWGKKKLAYPINKNSFGFYFVWKITLPIKNTAAFKNKLAINQDVLRSLLLKI